MEPHPFARVEESRSSSSSPNIDLIGNLMNYPHILESIFGYLAPKDLRVLPCVSTRWRHSIYNITLKSNRRRLRALRQLKKAKRRVGTENWPIEIECAQLKRRLRSQQTRIENVHEPQAQPPNPQPRRRTLGAIQNVVTANHKLPKVKKPLEHLYSNEEDEHERPVRKKSRWTLAQVPFKKW